MRLWRPLLLVLAVALLLGVGYAQRTAAQPATLPLDYYDAGDGVRCYRYLGGSGGFSCVVVPPTPARLPRWGAS